MVKYNCFFEKNERLGASQELNVYTTIMSDDSEKEMLGGMLRGDE
jgi:hypothetical protein